MKSLEQEYIHFHGGNTEHYALSESGFLVTELEEGDDLYECVETCVLDTFLQVHFPDQYESEDGYELEIDLEKRYFSLEVDLGLGVEEIYGYF